MNYRVQRTMAVALASLLLLISANTTWAGEGEVAGWFKAGNDPKGYAIGTVDTDRGHVAYIRSLEPDPEKFGTLMQSFDADRYLGKRIRLQAMIRTEDVKNWVGMWMRVDTENKSVAFDNMQNRALRGSLDWQEYSIVLDVPDDADTISIGIILAGIGRAEWDSIKLEIVADDVPLTDMNHGKRSRKPANLNFEN